MKWINGLTFQEKIRRKSLWHEWYAWFPVRVGVTKDGHGIYAWLETVMRKGTYHCWGYDCHWTYEYMSYGLKEAQ
jgi:hypothetical protein